MAPNGGFQPRKRKIVARRPQKRTRKLEAARVSAFGSRLDRRPAWKSKPQQLRRLVESLAHRIIDRRAQPLELTDTTADQQLAMPTRHEQQQIGIRDPTRQARRQRMRFKMVQRNERLARSKCHSFGRRQPDSDTAHEPRPRSDSNPVNIPQSHPRIRKRTHDDGLDELHMRTRRNFRNNPAIGTMRIELASDHVRQDFARSRHCTAHHGCGCFVAACFHAQNRQHVMFNPFQLLENMASPGNPL